MDVFLIAVVILVALAISDLVVGVSNDAVNFLNSSIGSRVAPRYIIMIIASLGILAGVTFSSGMMEVARKGIFHPKMFMMPELMIIFLAVMLTDILLLDLFNTFGFPTSTTVSIVFELLGAAVAVSIIKIQTQTGNASHLAEYINTGKALAIISGILLSVIIAFICGAIAQFISRLIFTFDYQARLKRYGAIWGGIALSMIIYFILVKGSKGASFITEETMAWIKTHTMIIVGMVFTVSFVLLQMIMWLTRINILKIIVLVGTFALAMAFAANDLVNFIGVPVAGLNAYTIAQKAADPLTVMMEGLQKPIKTSTWMLLFAGAIMVVTLWLSRKARTVTETEVSLGRQEEGYERFSSTPLSRATVRMFSSIFEGIRILIPESFREFTGKRFNPADVHNSVSRENHHFDLLRASVNLMVASAVVSFATSMKLPLSTTYVTFMVAMGTSLSDQAWGRESAVYRVAGVFAVIGGWFFTAFMAFTVAMAFAFTIYYLEGAAVIIILALVLYFIWRNHNRHTSRHKEKEELEVFNLEKVEDSDFATRKTFEHSGIFLREVNRSIQQCMESLFSQDRQALKQSRRDTQKIQLWANIIIANVFKVLRLLLKDNVRITREYTGTITALQEIAESHRDIIMRSYVHISNHHKGLLQVQKQEILETGEILYGMLNSISSALLQDRSVELNKLEKDLEALKESINRYDSNQILRIQDESSKTRLSILFYGILGNYQKIAEQTVNLLKIFHDSFEVRK